MQKLTGRWSHGYMIQNQIGESDRRERKGKTTNQDIAMQLD